MRRTAGGAHRHVGRRLPPVTAQRMFMVMSVSILVGAFGHRMAVFGQPRTGHQPAGNPVATEATGTPEHFGRARMADPWSRMRTRTPVSRCADLEPEPSEDRRRHRLARLGAKPAHPALGVVASSVVRSMQRIAFRSQAALERFLDAAPGGWAGGPAFGGAAVDGVVEEHLGRQRHAGVAHRVVRRGGAHRHRMGRFRQPGLRVASRRSWTGSSARVLSCPGSVTRMRAVASPAGAGRRFGSSMRHAAPFWQAASRPARGRPIRRRVRRPAGRSGGRAGDRHPQRLSATAIINGPTPLASSSTTGSLR